MKSVGKLVYKMGRKDKKNRKESNKLLASCIHLIWGWCLDSVGHMGLYVSFFHWFTEFLIVSLSFVYFIFLDHSKMYREIPNGPKSKLAKKKKKKDTKLVNATWAMDLKFTLHLLMLGIQLQPNRKHLYLHFIPSIVAWSVLMPVLAWLGKSSSTVSPLLHNPRLKISYDYKEIYTKQALLVAVPCNDIQQIPIVQSVQD